MYYYTLWRPLVLWRCFSSSIVTLYLWEEDTSLLILVPSAVGTVIEVGVVSWTGSLLVDIFISFGS